ncbi:hypothetical protein VIGAN_04233100, partial [Vigna angularis var. angularis]
DLFFHMLFKSLAKEFWVHFWAKLEGHNFGGWPSLVCPCSSHPLAPSFFTFTFLLGQRRALPLGSPFASMY